VANICAIVLAAGKSRRMGQPKLLLPWGGTNVLGQVIETLQHSGIEDILVITGGTRQQVENALSPYAVRNTYNEHHADGEMLSSIQCGLRAQLPQTHAALVCLGDQPQVREATVRRICAAFVETGKPLIVPSYHNRRGHPWLVARPLWEEILVLPVSATPRTFLQTHAAQVVYIPADESILQDLDTPEDYARQRP
jgi:molybdenum cofactor cytidylyltransferase